MADKQINVNIVVSEKGVKSASKNIDDIYKSINKLNKSMKTNTSTIKSFGSNMGKVGTQTTKLDGKVNKATDSFRRFHGILIGIMGINFVRRLQEYTDAWVNLINSVKLGVKEFYNISPVMNRVFDIAQRSRTELEPISKLFRRMSLASDQLGASYTEMLRVTETITKAIKISGSTTQESARAIEQLAQAFSEGVIKAKDFRSIISQAPRVVTALADELTGGNISKLKKMLSTSKISIQEIFQALISQSGNIDAEFGRLLKTMGEGWTILENSARKYVGELVTSKGITEKFSQVMKFLSKNMATLAQVASSLALGAIGGLIIAFSSMIMPLTLITGSVMGLIKLYQHWGTFRDIVNSTLGSLKKFAIKLKESYDYYTKNEEGIKKVNEVLSTLISKLDDVLIVLGSIFIVNYAGKITKTTTSIKILNKSLAVLKITLLPVNKLFAGIFSIGLVKNVGGALTEITKMNLVTTVFRASVVRLGTVLMTVFKPLALVAFIAMIGKLLIQSKMFQDDMKSAGVYVKKFFMNSFAVGPALKAIDSLIDKTKLLWKIFSEMNPDELYIRFKYSVKLIWASIVDSFQSIGNAIIYIMAVAVNSIWDGFKFLGESIAKLFKNIFKDLTSFGSNIGRNIYNIKNKGASWTTIFDMSEKDKSKVKDQFLNFGKDLTNTMNKGIVDADKLLGMYFTDPKMVKSYITEMNREIAKLKKASKFDLGYTGIKEATKKASSEIQQIMMPKFSPLNIPKFNLSLPTISSEGQKDAYKDFLENISGGFDNITKKATVFAEELSKKVAPVTDKIAQTMKDTVGFVGDLVDSLKNFSPVFDELFTGIESGLDRMANEWSNMTKSIESWTMSSFDKMGDAVFNFFTTGKSGWKDLARTALHELNKILWHKMIGMMLQGFNFGGSNAGGGNITGFQAPRQKLSFGSTFSSITSKSSESSGSGISNTDSGSSGTPMLMGSNTPGAALPQRQQKQESRVAVAPVNITNVNAFDSEEAIQSMLATPSGQRMVLNIVSKNKRELGFK